MTDFQGVYAASITPRGKQGEMDLGAAFELIDHFCAAKLRGVVLFGAWGEYPAFAAEERSRLVYLAVKRSRVPVLAGVGSATLDASMDLAREARAAGAAGVLLPPPYCFRFEAEDIREFYLEFARQMGPGIAVFLSNNPALTNTIPSETAFELLETGKFAGIEDGCGNAESFFRTRSAANGAWQVLMGNDAVFTSARCAGVRCAVSAVACAVPELVMALDGAIASGRQDQVTLLDTALREFLNWATRFPPPTIVRVATGLRGLKTGPVTMPLSAEKQRLLEEFRGWFPPWLAEVKRLCGKA